jgi:CIC family chloride channel protein
LSRQLLQPKRLAIFEACLIGLVAGLAAVLLKQGVGWLGGWRVHATHLVPAWLALPAIGLVGGFIAGWLVEYFAPETSGSGIPQVKAVLARVPMPMDLRVAFIKLVSGILALGSGLSLGREGPTVQTGAALAAQLSRWVPTSPDDRRQLIAAGAGAGLAAAFNAPIAGVLFVVEELLQDVSRLTLGTAILASFIGSVVSRVWGGQSLDIDLNIAAPQTSFSVEEIPFYLILGGLAGLLGALFNQGILLSLNFNFRVLHLGLPWRVGLAGLVSGLVVALLPTAFHDNAGLRELLITGEASWEVAAIAFVAQFIIILVAYGSGAPGGLFAPTLILGAALGYLVGGLEHRLFGLGMPTTYALAGMGAFFSAVVRVPVTAIVIVFEMTTDFNLVLPLMIGSVIAYLVGEKIASGSLYERLLEWKGIHLEKDTPTSGPLAQLTAADVMQRRVETLASQMTLDEAVQAFSRSHHRGFPVVDNGKLVGIVTQTDLANIAQRQLTGETTLSEIMTPQPMTVSPKETLAHVLYLLNHTNLSRLPVMDNRKLVGIITRGDIIRAESEQLSGEIDQVGPRTEPSYVVYQTCSPATGQGRLLVPLANPETADSLLKLAAAIARDRHYEMECLQVILVPRSNSPAETTVKTTKSRRLLRQAERCGQDWQIPVHTQVRVAHDIAQAILETLKERHIDLVLMGWEGKTSTPGRVFGNIVDTLIRQAASDVILVKLSPSFASGSFNRWLVPIAGGPNSRRAIQLLPALTSLSRAPKICLCQVFDPSESLPDTKSLEQDVSFLKRHLKHSVSTILVRAKSVPEAIVNLAQTDHDDVIVIGASRESLLQQVIKGQVIKGNIPEAIAHASSCTVILVREAITANPA